jgi:hypothetical protein
MKDSFIIIIIEFGQDFESYIPKIRRYVRL